MTTPHLRDEPRLADRARDRDRLLAADRLPLPRGARPRAVGRGRDRAHDADRRPRRHLLGRCRSRSGSALLLFMPLPFMRAMGVGGFLIPLVSIAAAATLQPALLSLYGRRGTHRVAVAAFLRDRLRLPVRGSERPDDVEHRFWARLARSIMRRKWRYVTVIGAAARRGGDPGRLAPADARARPRASRSPRSRSGA